VNRNFERAILLYQQNRHEQAEQELRQALAADPQDAQAHSLLSLCLCERKQFQEATVEARQAIALAPDFAFSHYAHARVLSERNHEQEALAAIREAIRLDPRDADYGAWMPHPHGTENSGRGARGRRTGPSIDAEHVACTNLRRDGARQAGPQGRGRPTIDAALARNPDNAVTHANQGWTLLHQGDPKRALEHFGKRCGWIPARMGQGGDCRGFEGAQRDLRGHAEVFPVHGKLSSHMQWGDHHRRLLLSRMLAGLAQRIPTLRRGCSLPHPLRGLRIDDWLAYPLFNLLLRLNRFGGWPSRASSSWNRTGSGLRLLALASLVGCLAMGSRVRG